MVKKLDDLLKKKAVRMLGNKASLASRIDLAGSGFEIGAVYKQQIKDTLFKVSQPPLVKKRPIPVPETQPRKVRGGARIRAAKKRTQQTEIRTLKNRLKFGAEPSEEYDEPSMGMLGTSDRIRVTASA